MSLTTLYSRYAVALDRLERAGHQREQLHLAADQLEAGQRRMLVRGRVEQPGQVRREPDLGDHDRTIGLGGQGLAQDRRRGRRRSAREQVVGISELPGRVLLLDQREVLALLDDAPLPHHADRDVAAAVEGVDRVDERCGQLVVDADRHRQQPAMARATGGRGSSPGPARRRSRRRCRCRRSAAPARPPRPRMGVAFRPMVNARAATATAVGRMPQCMAGDVLRVVGFPGRCPTRGHRSYG